MSVQIKINTAHPMGMLKLHEGKTYTAERLGNGYRLKSPLSHLIVHDAWINKGHAEIVETCAFPLA